MFDSSQSLGSEAPGFSTIAWPLELSHSKLSSFGATLVGRLPRGDAFSADSALLGGSPVAAGSTAAAQMESVLLSTMTPRVGATRNGRTRQRGRFAGTALLVSLHDGNGVSGAGAQTLSSATLADERIFIA